VALGEFVDFFVQVSDLGFRVDAGFEFDVGADAIARALAVLAGEHEQGQENRFERYDHRQELEGVRIEGRMFRSTLRFSAIQPPRKSACKARNHAPGEGGTASARRVRMVPARLRHR
jgi:hypothetical protein